MRLLFWRGASTLSNIIHVCSVTAHKNEVTLSVPYVPQHNADAGATDHSCSICGKCLSSASSLDRHMLVHSGERPYKCNVCGQTFTTNGNMHRWSERTHTRPATCQPIGDEHLIRVNMQRQTSGLHRPHICPHFKSLKNLCQCHCLTHTHTHHTNSGGGSWSLTWSPANRHGRTPPNS